MIIKTQIKLFTYSGCRNLLLLLTALFFGMNVHGADRGVSTSGMDVFVLGGTNNCLVVPCATIRHAVNQASPGDRVLLEPTTHNAHGIVLNKDLTIESSSSTIAARIDAGNAGRHFTIDAMATVIFKKLILTHGHQTNGGALHNSGIANLLSVYFIDNDAVRGGAMFNVGTLEGENVNFSENTADFGGAIHNEEGGSIMLDNTLIRENSVNNNGGAIYNNAGTVELKSARLFNNTSGVSGGALYNVTGDIIIMDSELAHNEAGSDGGHIYNLGGSLQLNRSDVEEGLAGNRGGAIANVISGLVILEDTELSHNLAQEGGAIYTSGLIQPPSKTTVRRSTLYENTAGPTSPVVSLSLSGGGIFTDSGGEVVLVNSTLSGNVADRFGGGVKNQLGAELFVANTTFAGNGALGGGGGTINNVGNIVIDNSIITDSTGGDCRNVGVIATSTTNLVDNNAGGGCSTVSSAAVTGFDLVLSYNGGFSLTHAIDPTSNAVDTGINNCIDPTSFQPLFEDQRLHVRPQGAACDIGSYEVAP